MYDFRISHDLDQNIKMQEQEVRLNNHQNKTLKEKNS